MQLSTNIRSSYIDDEYFDVVERKGVGHPDTLADGLAEAVSREYSLECLRQYGVILHHNSDKTALLGGASKVKFGHGEMTRPIQVLVNGRFSRALGGSEMDVDGLIDRVAKDFLRERLPLLDVDKDVLVHTRNNPASSPGHVETATNAAHRARSHWFAPRSLSDLPELTRMFGNDTSCGVGYAPHSLSELVALGVEGALNSTEFNAEHPEFGTDVKVMVCRNGENLDVTLCVPQIAKYTPDLDTYVQRKRFLLDVIEAKVAEIAPNHRLTVALNTRDDHDKQELYLTAIGTALESGDEGVVGRGNRITGTISVLRPMSMEGVAGKNPVYHIGKLYNLLARKAATELYELTGSPTTVTLVSQSGRDLEDPWFAAVDQARCTQIDDRLVRKVIEDVMSSVDDVRTALLADQMPIC
jgi:S-adenosylmethionine synthetase